MAPTMRERRRSTRGWVVSAGGASDDSVSTALGLVVNPAPLGGELEQRHAKDRDEEEDSSGAALAEGKIAKGQVVDVEDQRPAGVERPAVGQHEDLVERLEGKDDGDDDREKNRRREERQRDVAKDPEAIRAVDQRRLLKRWRNVLETGEEDDHIQSEAPPNADQGDGRHDEPRGG